MDVKLLVLVHSVLLGSARCYSFDLNTVMHSLLVDYDKNLPPAHDGVDVKHTLYLSRIVDLDDQILTTDTYIVVRWTDERLAWDPASLEGIDSLRVPAKHIWFPDITLYNDASFPTPCPDSNIHVDLDNNGNLTFVQKSKFRSYCDYDITYLHQYSKVTCNLVFGSWTYGTKELSLANPKGDIDLTEYTAGSALKIADSSVSTEKKKFEFRTECYAILKYSLTLQFI